MAATRNVSSDTKRVMMIGGVGLVVILGLLAFSLSRGGGSSSSSPPTTTVPSSRSVSERALASGRRAQTSPSTTTTTTTTPVNSMPDSFETFTERNPFQPAVGVSTGVTTTPDTSGTTGTTPTTAPATSGTASGTGTGTGATTETTTASQNPSAGTVVQLVEVVPGSPPSARVQVASTVYTVTPGQTFDTSYKLVSLSGTCGQFLFGDSPFQLCQGQQVLK